MSARYRLPSYLLTLAVVVTGAFAAWAVTHNSTPAEGALTGRPVTVTPTPAILPPASDMTQALAKLRSASPGIAATIDATLRGDASAVVDAAPATSGPCESFVVRGVTLCERSGLTPGTTVEQISLNGEGLPGFRMERPVAGQTVRYLLDGRGPELQLLAARDDGATLAVITIAPRAALQFPGPLRLGGADVATLYMTVGPGGTVLDLEQRVVGAPPLEPVRNGIRLREHDYVISAASAAFVNTEKAWDDANEAAKRTPPAP
jgi:hypothetical protein